MKKVISFILIALALVACFTLCAGAESKQFDLPQAVTAPTVDGKISDGEWDDALTIEMKKGDANLFVAAGTADTFEGATFKFLWTFDGIYFAADVADKTAPAFTPEADSGSYNGGDGVQFNIYTSADVVGQDPGTLLFFSFNPKTSTGKACVGEHFVYGNGTEGANVITAKVAAELNDNAYVIEGLIPADAFISVNPPVSFTEGAKIYMNCVVMECDEANNQSLIVDNEWFDPTKANVYTLASASETEAEAKDDASALIESNDPTAPKNNFPESEKTDSDKDEVPADAANIGPWLYIGIGIAVVVIAAVVILVAKKAKKK